MNVTLHPDDLADLVDRTHTEGITGIAAAALIEHGGRFLLVETTPPDFDTPPGWALPTGRIRAGETLLDGLDRVLRDHFALDPVHATRYLGHNDHDHEDGRTTRVFVFAVTADQPDAICRTAHIGHRWIDNISISTTVADIDPILRVYYAGNFV